MDFYDDYCQPDMFGHMTNPEHALQSPTALMLCAGQNNVFMYEQEHNTVPVKQEMVTKSYESENIFEFPNPEEMAKLGCSPVDPCWPDTPLLAGSLDGSLNDSGMCFGWELSDDEPDAIFKPDFEPFGSTDSTAPTLAELNMEDSQSRDCLALKDSQLREVVSLKRKQGSIVEEEKKLKNPCLTKLLGQQEMSLSPQSWKRVKTEALEIAKNDSGASYQSSNVVNLKPVKHAKKASRTKASKGVERTPHREGGGKNKVKGEKPAKLSLNKVHPSKMDFTEIFWKRYRANSMPSPTKDMSRSEFIARTPNPFGNRRFLGKNAFIKPKSDLQSNPSPSKVLSAPVSSRTKGDLTPIKLSRTALNKTQQKSNHHQSRSKPRRHTVSSANGKLPVTMVATDESSQDKLWKELQEFMYGEKQKAQESKKSLPNRTLGSEFDLKSDMSKSPRSSDPGFDSHDEGLGSENEDHDDDDSDDDLADDISEISEDPGLPTTSTKSKGKSSQESGRQGRRRRKMKQRRSEYDDFTPNPRKLLHIGHELNKLNMRITSLTPGNEASNDEKNYTRREKNKLASRACRLKKKAQHEANKVKLWGLVEEAKQLKVVLKSMREEIGARTTKPSASWDYSLGAKLDHLIKTSLGHMVAGHTSEFVNSVLEKTAKGIPISQLSTTLQ